MNRYVVAIEPKNLPLITLLNGGVTPEIEEKPTYFVLTIEGPDTSHPQIVTYETYIQLKIDNHIVFFALRD